MVEVVEIVTEVSGYLYFGPPKTRAGYRRVGLPRVVVEALAEQLACPGSADDLAFMGPQGGTLRLAGFRHRIWRPATRAAGLDGLRIHDLRHTAVALWIAAGANPRRSPLGPGTPRSVPPSTAMATCIRTRIRRSGTAWTRCMPSPRHAGPHTLTDQRRARRAAPGWKADLNRRRTGHELLVWLVGVTGLEPVTSSL
jgi:hypothetical protein